MWDHLREWSLAIGVWLSSLVAIIMYIMGITGDVALVKQRVDQLEKENIERKEWLVRIEAKLDLVLYKSEYRS